MWWILVLYMLLSPRAAQCQVESSRTSSSSQSVSVPTPSASIQLSKTTIPTKTAIPTRTKTTTATPSLSMTQPPVPGTLQWEVSSGKYDSNYEPVIVDTELRTNDFTLNGRLIEDRLLWNMSDPIRFLNVTVLEKIAVQARGLERRMGEGFVITKKSLLINPDGRFELTLFADDFFEVRRDEIVQLEFLSNITASGLVPKNSLQFRIRAFVYPPDPTMESLISAGGIASGIGVVFGGIPGSQEVHALAMVISMSCVDKKIARFGGSAGQFVLSPLPYGDAPRGKLSGNVGFVCYVFILQIIFFYIVRFNIPTMRFSELSKRTWFPSLPYGFSAYMFPGFCFFTVRSVYEVVGGGLTVVVLLLCLVWIFTTFFMFRFISCQKQFLGRQYSLTDPSTLKGCSHLTQPRGTWGPPHVLQMYRSVIGELDSKNEYFVYVGIVFGSLCGIMSGVNPASQDGCKFQFSCLAITFAIFSFIYWAKRPYRYTVQNVLSGLNCCCLLMVTGASADATDATRDVFQAGFIFLVLFAIFRVVYGLIMTRRENRRKHRVDQSSPPPVPQQLESYGHIDDVESQGTSSEEELDDVHNTFNRQ